VSRAVEFLDCKKRLRLQDGSRYSVAVSKHPQACSYCGGEIRPGEPYVIATEGGTRRRLHLKCLMEAQRPRLRVFYVVVGKDALLCPW
jgi:hypothetical protein